MNLAGHHVKQVANGILGSSISCCMVPLEKLSSVLCVLLLVFWSFLLTCTQQPPTCLVFADSG